jgi:hypothetical protein
MTQQNQPQIIVCEKCQHEFKLTDGLNVVAVGNDASQVLVVCPNCDESKHAYFETPDITAARLRLSQAAQRFQAATGAEKEKRWTQYKFQQETYKRIFDAEQQRWRRKRGMAEKVA